MKRKWRSVWVSPLKLWRSVSPLLLIVAGSAENHVCQKSFLSRDTTGSQLRERLLRIRESQKAVSENYVPFTRRGRRKMRLQLGPEIASLRG